MKNIQFSLEILKEPDGSYTGSLHEIDLLVNATSPKAVTVDMINELIEYAKEYMSDFEYYVTSKNRKAHLPYVNRVLLDAKESEKLEELFHIDLKES